MTSIPPGNPGASPSSRPPVPPGVQRPTDARRFDVRKAQPTLHPRRVVGGIRLQSRPPAITPGQSGQEIPADAASSGWTWASARWIRPVEERAPGEQLAEGLDYARIGQARSLEFKAGQVSARVQGRMPQAYKTAVRLPTFTPEQWEKVSAATAAQAKYAAALLAGELPPNIEDLFAPVGLSLFPADASDLSCSCECDVFTGRPRDPAGAAPQPGARARAGASAGTPWCKHVCCLMYLIADRLGQSPLTIFSLRGLAEADLLERLRQARALQGLQRAGTIAAPIYTPHVPGVSVQTAPLEELLDQFWCSDQADALDGLDMPIAAPEVSHPLLRRVGPSPFAGAKFPLVGLLATCYDVISQAAIQGVAPPEPAGADPSDGSPA